MKEWKMTNKKKIRGWKRQIKKIDEWKQQVLNLDMNYMEQHQRDYAKLWIDPFYRLIRRNPPVWYRRLILQAMFEVYMNWYKQMKVTGEPFYLKIWLYEPHFMNSQIVVAYRECLHFYDQTFDKADYEQRFSHDKYELGELLDVLRKLDWQLHVDAIDYFESDLSDDFIELRDASINARNVRSKAYRVFEVEGDVVYRVRVGDVWVGELDK
jgi:hypothetical protein